MQTTVQKSSTIRMGSVKFSADFGQGYVNLGALKNASLKITKQKTELTFDNAKMPPKVKILEAILSAELYELSLEAMRNINGLGEFSSLDWTQTSKTELIPAGSLKANEAYILAGQNADGSEPTMTSVTYDKGGANTAWNKNTNYSFTKIGGKQAIIFKSAVDKPVELVYNYTPPKSKELLFKDVITSQSLSKYKFENENDEGKIFMIEFFEGFNNSDNLEISFKSDDETNDASSMQVEIKAFPTTDKKLFRIYDEQDHQ